MAAASAGAAELRAAELVMMEQPGCVWCKRFNEEVAPQYGKTREGQLAPLRRVDITEPWPEDLAAVAPERLTPTFVLVHEGRELDRLRGYPGDDFFWGLLGRMLEKVPGHGDTSSTPER
ncbi:transcriptional regulator [Skermanella mucosa]|uniref:transcriptional regulator n=1 Tax=Skermanella mucosa TaxID=1789672 RepID=UPI00192B6051|nr:transcriptional regulator [Skermanella mucosa]UEM19155.1 transcriptional regulator [Skermanella mucosa]